jgi:enolase-like protein
VIVPGTVRHDSLVPARLGEADRLRSLGLGLPRRGRIGSETERTVIAQSVTAIAGGTDQTGAPPGSERTASHIQQTRIEGEIGYRGRVMREADRWALDRWPDLGTAAAQRLSFASTL